MSVLASTAAPLAKVNFSRGLDTAWQHVASFVPKFVAFLVILIVGYIIAKVLEKVLAKVLQRVGFDRLVERGGVKKALANSKYDAAGILGRLVFYTILLFTLSTAFGVFGTNPISNYLRAVVAYLPKVFAAILILIVAAAIAAGVKGLIQNTLGGLSYGRLLGSLAAAFILTLGVIAALDQFNIARNVVNAVLIAALATIAGIAIVAIGGGGIGPMQQRWQSVLSRYDQEKPRMQQAVTRVKPPQSGVGQSQEFDLTDGSYRSPGARPL